MEGDHIPLLAMYEEVSPGKVDVLAYYEQIRIAGAERKLQVFYDRGNDFCEKDSVVLPMGKHGVKVEIPIPSNVNRLRLDPGEAAGGLFLKNLSLENEKKIPFTTNGFPIAKHKYYFGAGDPQFIISDIPQGEHTLRFEIEVIREQEARDRFWKEFSRVSAQRDQEIQHLKRQIHEMENTKVWKMYRSIRKK